MTHYKKNGEVIVRSYPTTMRGGYKFEEGIARSEHTSPFIVNSFFATSSRHCDTKAELRRAIKALGEVVAVEID